MSRLFLRFYLALGVVAAVCGLLLLAVERLADAGTGEERLQAMATAPPLIAERLARATDPQARERALVDLAAALDAPVEAQPVAMVRSRLDGLDVDHLDRGEPVVAAWTDGATALLVPVPDQPLVAVVLAAPPPTHGWHLAVVAVALLLGLAGAVFATLWPLQRQLQALSDAASAYGDGHLDLRAPVLTDDAAGALALRFNAMAERVQGLVHGRQELLMAISHELRTPVARLRFAVEMLVDEADDAQRATRGARVQDDLAELQQLIGELLEYSSLEEGSRELSLETLDPLEELADQVGHAEQLDPQTRVAFEAGELPELRADRRLLRRLLGNLLSNAVRYGQGEVRVRAAVQGEHLVVDVEDNGPGVPEHARERVFEPLVRLDEARTRDKGGVGLGLALAREVARVHGGSLRVLDSDLGGACFRVELPLGGP